MNSLGIFHDVNLKNNNNVLSSLKRACDQTSNLVDYMDNYKKPSNINKSYKSININNNQIKRRNQSLIGRIGRNIMINNNSAKIKIKKNEYNRNKNKLNKYQNLKNKIFGSEINRNNNNNYYKQKNNEPYNYNKEYENNLIDEIENLFHPNPNINERQKINYKIKNAKEIIPNNYMDIYSLMEEIVKKVPNNENLVSDYGINFDGRNYICGRKNLEVDDFSLLGYTISPKDVVEYL